VYKAIIVDDDVETLRGLEKFIEWGSHGFTVAATARSAEQAIPIIEDLQPELLVTDITMTGQDGFSLLSRARTLLPDLETVILTCHADFSFAQTAIDSDVAAYLTKVTLTEDELVRALDKVRERLQRSSSSLQNRLDVQSKLIALMHRDSLSIGRLGEAGLSLPEATTEVRMAVVSPCNPIDRSNLPSRDTDDQTWLFNTVAPRFPSGFLALAEDSRIIVLEPVAADAAPYHSFLTAVEELVGLASTRFHCAVTATVSSHEPLDRDAVDLYHSLSRRIDDAYYEVGNTILRPLERQAKKAPEPTGEGPSTTTAEGRRVASTERPDESGGFSRNPEAVAEELLSGDVESAVARLHGEISTFHPEPATVRALERSLYDYLQIKAHEVGASVPHFAPSERFSVCVERLRSVCRSIEEARLSEGQISSRGEINRVARYVRDHLSEPISAESMAQLASMSLSHFSRVFKKESGLTFSEYLSHTRVDAAKRRLQSGNDVVDEIARATGFENAAYFYRVFKRVTGKTPGEFRQGQ
jgi:two-component system response regulator YesN